MLETKINEDLKTALKRGEKTKLSVLRMLVSAIKNKKIEDRVKELDDDKIIAVIQKTLRQHDESIECFKKAAREDLVTKETEEAKVLGEYLPQQLSEEELKKIVNDVILKSGASSIKDMGAVMKAVLELVKGSADSKLVSRIVREKLVGQ